MRIPSIGCQSLRLRRRGSQQLTHDRTTDVAVALHDAAGKAVGPAAYPCGLWDDLQLVFVVGNDLSQLILNVV